MECRYNNSLSPEWITEKINCINHSAWNHAESIKTILRKKLENAEYFLRPREFAEILVFKGLARLKKKFLKEYQNLDTVENITNQLLASGFNNFSFTDTFDQNISDEILHQTNQIINNLIQLKYVGIPVASAALTLIFPHLFGTVDYIVPGLMHCTVDDLGSENPFLDNLDDINRFQTCLLLQNGRGMTPSLSRNLAQSKYSQYIQELWNIKREYGLEHKVSEIEVSLWSYGICYIKKQKDNNKPLDNRPFRFQIEPKSPSGGLFAKNCPIG